MGQNSETDKAFSEISKRSVKLSQKLAEASFNMRGVTTDVEKQNNELKEAKKLTQKMEDNSKVAANHSNELVRIVGQTKNTVHTSTSFAEKAAEHINHLIDRSLATNEALKNVGDYLVEMPNIAHTMSRIASSLRVLGFNAGILSVQFGGDSKGFGVVAEEMKVIAGEVGRKTDEINRLVNNMTSHIETAIKESESARSNAEVVRGETEKMIGSFKHIDHDVSQVKKVSNDVKLLSEKNFESCHSVLNNIGVLSEELEVSNQKLSTLDRSIDNSLNSFEDMVRIINNSEIQTADTPFIDLAKQVAKKIGNTFENAISNGEISLEDLFDRSRKPLPGTNPTQYLTRFVEFADRVLSRIQEPVLKENPQIAFCVAVAAPDGYLPTHNLIYSNPQRLEPETEEDINWNVANCRNRRIFDDRTGFAGANSTEEFLLMTYCRDMGGRRVIMNDVSAPIFVHQKHWGGFRIGYAV